jgi:hypothetical protein
LGSGHGLLGSFRIRLTLFFEVDSLFGGGCVWGLLVSKFVGC